MAPPYDQAFAKSFPEGEKAATDYPNRLRDLERRLTSDRNNLHAWRLTTFSLCGVVALLSLTLAYVASKQPIPAVHLVEIDKQTGEPVRHRLAGDVVEVDEAMIMHVIGRWIQITRGKSIDPVVLQANWEDAYQFVPTASKAHIDAYARRINAFDPDTLGTEAVTVEIASINRQSEDSFQVRWRETVYRDSRREDQRDFTANLRVALQQPATPRQIQSNPLGVMITEIYVQPDFRLSERTL